MKKFKGKLTWLMIVLLLVVTSLGVSACTKTSVEVGVGEDPPPTWVTSDWTTMPENTNANFKYFGYFHVDGFKGKAPFYNEISALENSNVMMINSAWSIEQSVSALASVKEMGAKCFITPHNFFGGGAVGMANSATLNANYVADWDASRAAIKSYIDDGTILGFYFDEPAWNGVKEVDFRTVTKMIKEQYPSIKIMNCMTVYDVGISKHSEYPEISASYNEYCTDVMYDSYADWNDELRRDYLEKLKSKAINNQFIWGCAKGFSENPDMTEQMAKNIKGMYTEALQEPRYVGIISFSYADGIDADWGYGLNSFFNNESEYYSRSIKKLYINIGRKIIGLAQYDFTKDIDLIVQRPQEVYSLGEIVPLPLAGAIDGNETVLELSCTVTDPRGNKMDVQDEFVAVYSGKYILTYSAGEGDKKIEKSIGIFVRQSNEISLFDDEAYVADATGNNDDLWCWPRRFSSTIKHSGAGSLLINTHATDGTWPRVIFGRNDYVLWDITTYDAISLWAYNPSDAVLPSLKFVVGDEADTESTRVYSGVDLPSKVWTQVIITKAFIQETSPTLDLTKVKIIYGQTGATYVNRTPFYIDDVTFIQNEFNFTFDNQSGLNNITGTVDDKWCWATSISTEQKKAGESSLKIAPHATDGTWPNLVFLAGMSNEFNLSNLDSVSIWVYNPSLEEISNFGLKINNGDKIKDVTKTFALPPSVWTECIISKAEILNQQATIDLTKAQISFSQLGGTYTNRTVFYLDEFKITLAK